MIRWHNWRDEPPEVGPEERLLILTNEGEYLLHSRLKAVTVSVKSIRRNRISDEQARRLRLGRSFLKRRVAFSTTMIWKRYRLARLPTSTNVGVALGITKCQRKDKTSMENDWQEWDPNGTPEPETIIPKYNELQVYKTNIPYQDVDALSWSRLGRCVLNPGYYRRNPEWKVESSGFE